MSDYDTMPVIIAVTEWEIEILLVGSPQSITIHGELYASWSTKIDIIIWEGRLIEYVSDVVSSNSHHVVSYHQTNIFWCRITKPTSQKGLFRMTTRHRIFFPHYSLYVRHRSPFLLDIDLPLNLWINSRMTSVLRRRNDAHAMPS